MEDQKSIWDKFVLEANNDPLSQVGRTLKGEPMSSEMFLRMTDHIINQMDIQQEHEILDLCCGNGLITNELAKFCKKIVGVDFNQKLLNDIAKCDSQNIEVVLANTLEVDFEPRSFDRILIAAALQHFTLGETIILFRKAYNWLKPNGIFLVTDITDSSNIWEYYNTHDRRSLYFTSIEKETSVLGTWFDREWLKVLARHVGFRDVKDIDQPVDYWYSHYRFDFSATK